MCRKKTSLFAIEGRYVTLGPVVQTTVHGSVGAENVVLTAANMELDRIHGPIGGTRMPFCQFWGKHIP